MASSLSNLVNNLAAGIHKIKGKTEHNNNKAKRVEIYFIEDKNFKNDSIKYKCLCCNKNYQKSLMKI